MGIPVLRTFPFNKPCNTSWEDAIEASSARDGIEDAVSSTGGNSGGSGGGGNGNPGNPGNPGASGEYVITCWQNSSGGPTCSVTWIPRVYV